MESIVLILIVAWCNATLAQLIKRESKERQMGPINGKVKLFTFKSTTVILNPFSVFKITVVILK
jgi:hypothetical protein